MHGTPKSTVRPVVVAFADGPTPVGPLFLSVSLKSAKNHSWPGVVGERARTTRAHPLAPDVGDAQHDLAVELVAGRS